MSVIFKDDKSTAINGYDVVAYFEDNQALIGSPKIKYKFNDAEWHFKNDEHLKLFSENPQKYIPQFGGFCAYGISVYGKLCPTDPSVWEIIDRKLYLNFNKDYMEFWRENINENIEKGNKIWEKINMKKNSSSSAERIKAAFDRNEKLLKENPLQGQKTGKVKVTSNDGLLCNIESGQWKFKADMAENIGGTALAPTPGIYEAAALGSCLVIMAKIWGAKLEVPVNNIGIEVEFDSDSRVLYGVGKVPARWKAIRYNIEVESSASEKDIYKIFELAHQQSHVRGDFEHSFKIERSIKILDPK